MRANRAWLKLSSPDGLNALLTLPVEAANYSEWMVVIGDALSLFRSKWCTCGTASTFDQGPTGPRPQPEARVAAGFRSRMPSPPTAQGGQASEGVVAFDASRAPSTRSPMRETDEGATTSNIGSSTGAQTLSTSGQGATTNPPGQAVDVPPAIRQRSTGRVPEQANTERKAPSTLSNRPNDANSPEMP